MLDYNKRMQEAWSKVPTDRQRAILEELEHRVATQQFSTNTNDTNALEPIVDILAEAIAALPLILAWFINACGGAVVLARLLVEHISNTNKKEGK